jgi:hypothetical protein
LACLVQKGNSIKVSPFLSKFFKNALQPRVFFFPQTQEFILKIFTSRFEETNSASSTCLERLGQVCIGGYARVLTMVKKLQKERADQGKNPIYLNIGDNFQGTLWYELLGWNVRFLNHLESPVVVANFDDTDEPNLKVKLKI